MRQVKKYKVLKIKCTSSNCAENLHCFKASKKMKLSGEEGRCRTCKAALVDWDRVHKRNIGDIDYTFQSMKYEMIRHHFWHVEIDQRAVNYAKRKGKNGIREAIEKRIRTAIGPKNPYMDGMQTPMEGNPIFYAQHATACCCRKCLEYWHGIKQDKELTEEEIKYLSKLAEMYIDERLPGLTPNGEKVPVIKGEAGDSNDD